MLQQLLQSWTLLVNMLSRSVSQTGGGTSTKLQGRHSCKVLQSYNVTDINVECFIIILLYFIIDID